eukprot:TRINITY_DN1427_c3_g2_i1.p1 TRINITY_DN1427_c3_g2~~TRINITY_DN1427_c3_g2_i1.p1  ORF type:complete len:263 (+),score=52.27 TRINITY_DN1427_c3_g2_i1:250-1038(+)
MYAMGQQERKAQEEREEQQKAIQEREAQAEQRREARRKEEEERLVALGKRNVLVVIWDGFDEIVAVTCINVLRAADVNVVVTAINSHGLGHKCKPTTNARGRHGVSLVADISFETTCNSNFHLFNAVIVPGGSNIDVLSSNTKLVSLVKTLSYKEKFICGAIEAPYQLFARSGFVKKRRITGLPSLKAATPESLFQPCDDNVHVDYNLVTCRNSSDAVEFALTVVKCIFADESIALKVAEEMGHEAYVEKVKTRQAAAQASQ